MKHRPDGRFDRALEATAGRFGLDASEREQARALVSALCEDPLAPTAVREPGAVLNDHLADSLVALELAEVTQSRRIADLGSGPGLPGLALAIALPDADVCLIESNQRKCQFIARTAEACGLGNASVVPVRAEAWSEGVESCDLVTARALGPLAVVAEYSAPLLKLGGNLVVWRGRRHADEERAGQRAAAELGLDMQPPRSVYPYPGAAHRHLVLMRKRQPTPGHFPRRPGMARKRPLGADHRDPSDR